MSRLQLLLQPGRVRPALITLCVFAACRLFGGVAGGASREDEIVLVREIYVPVEEFKKLSSGKPEGIVMELGQYRKLVIQAVRSLKKPEQVVLPPLKASLLSAHYRGEVSGRSARFRASLRVRVGCEGWVRCDLGRLPAQMGAVLLDDAPAWIITEQVKGGRRGFLLLRGKGEHLLEFRFTLPVERWAWNGLFAVRGPLAPACGKKVELVVPQHVEAESSGGVLQVQTGRDHTTLVLSASTSPDFAFRWRPKRVLKAQEIYLEAEHLVCYAARKRDPRFTWEAEIKAARGKIEKLLVKPPAGTLVLKLTGPQVHSWSNTADGILITLKEPVWGEIRFHAEGALQETGPVYRLAPPQVEGTFAQSGYIALYELEGESIRVKSAPGYREAPLTEKAVPGRFPDETGASCRPVALFAYSGLTDSLEVEVLPRSNPFEVHGVFAATVLQRGAALEGSVRITVREGRRYGFEFTVPEAWRLDSIKELTSKGRAAYGLSVETTREEGLLHVALFTARAVRRGRPLEIFMSLSTDSERSGEAKARRKASFSLPAFEGSSAGRWDLAIFVPPGVDTVVEEAGSWRGLEPREAKELRLVPSGGREPAALLSSREKEAKLTLWVLKRPPRGVYRAVTHLLALERILRVRVDFCLSIVDRPVEEILFKLPARTPETAVIIGEGIKEIVSDIPAGTRLLRFHKPWRGTRYFRTEYELSLQEKEPFPVPRVEVEAPEKPCFFEGERYVVLQSAGPVEVRCEFGPGLTPMDPDELPDFGMPWPEGRILQAYRFKARGSPGTITTVVHPRAPVLENFVRKLDLTTLIDPGGFCRTRAEFMVAVGGAQRLEILLPEGSRPLAVSVNGEPLRAVVLPGEGGSGSRSVSIPLPALSYSTCTVVYESRHSNPLGRSGTWRQRSPEVLNMPVGVITWTLYVPKSYRFFFTGRGNLRPKAPYYLQEEGTFFGSFIMPLLSGRLPVFTTFRGVPRGPAHASTPALGLKPLGRKPGRSGKGAGGAQVLRPEGERLGTASAPVYPFFAEGRVLEAKKIGGGALLSLNYAQAGWWKFAKRTVFGITFLVGLFLFLRIPVEFFRLLFWGLLLGGILPYVFDWSSPLLLVPFCEGLIAAGLAAAVIGVLRVAFAPASTLKRSVRFYRGTALLLLCLFISQGTTLKGAQRVPVLPTEGVLIPFDPDRVRNFGEESLKVYVPRKTFERLSDMAQGAAKPEVQKGPAEYLLGGGNYTLTLTGDIAVIEGSFGVEVPGKGWVAVPLRIGPSRLKELRVNDLPAPVGTKEFVEGKRRRVLPFVALRGPGTYKVEVSLVCPVERRLGRTSVRVGLVKTAGATLKALLPASVRVAASAAGRPISAVIGEEAYRTVVTVDSGGLESFELAWYPRGKKTPGASRLSCISYLLLTLDEVGYRVERTELVKVAGTPLDALKYEIKGSWTVTGVSEENLREWSLTEEKGVRVLRVFFAKPVSRAVLKIEGRGKLEDRGKLPALALEGAVRQETYVGLRNGKLRRFKSGVLSGMERSSPGRILEVLPLAQKDLPQRLYRGYGDCAGEVIAAEPVRTEVTVRTAACVFIRRDRLTVAARVRYTALGPGPIRYEVLLPRAWSILSVEGEGVRDWEVLERTGGKLLVVVFGGRAQSGLEFKWIAEDYHKVAPEAIEIPAFFAGAQGPGKVRREVGISIASPEELQVRVEQSGPFAPSPLEPSACWLAPPAGLRYRFALRAVRLSEDTSKPLRLGVTGRKRLVGATLVCFVRPSDTFFDVNVRLVYQIRMAGLQVFGFRLPPGASLTGCSARNERSRNIQAGPEGTLVTLTLQSPVIGSQTIDVSYRLERKPGAEPLVTPLVLYAEGNRLENVDSYVGIVQTSWSVVTEARTKNLVAFEAERIPYLPAGVSRASLGRTYRATGLDWTVEIKQEEVEVAPGPPALVSLAELHTVIEVDGTRRTRVTYTIQNRALQFLQVELPAGARLWGVSLNGRPVAVGREDSAGASGGRILRVPVSYVGAGRLDLEMTIVYQEPALSLPAFMTSAILTAPKLLGVEVAHTLWRVNFPEVYKVSLSGGNMRGVPESAGEAVKVKRLLQQYDKLRKAAAQSRSRRLREQATQELLRLRQILSDDAAQLRQAARQDEFLAAESREARRQRDQSIKLWQQSQKVLGELKGVSAETKQQAKEAPPSGFEQSFIDTGNFMQNAWRQGKRVATERKRQQEGLRPKGVALGKLLGPGLRLSEAPAALQRRWWEEAGGKRLEAKGALKPLELFRVRPFSPGLEVLTETPARSAAFLRPGGGAEIVLSFTRRDAGRRIAALVLVALVTLGAVFRAFRRRDGFNAAVRRS